MRASVKEVEKLSADAKKAVGVSGGPSYGAAGKRKKKRGNKARQSGGDRSIPPGFVKPAANVPRESLGKKQEIVCSKCQEKGHFARACPNK
jgi:hypothetical protein